MRVLVAGARGELGSRVVPLLQAGGHEVVALTRSPVVAAQLRASGVASAVGDVLDREGVRRVLADIRPEAVVQAPIALPARGPLRFADIRQTNRLRRDGTAALVAAAVAAGVRHYVLESVVFSYGYGDLGPGPLAEDVPVQTTAPVAAGQPALDAMHVAEQTVTAAAREGLRTVVLRVGLYQGDVASTRGLADLLRRRLLALPREPMGRLSWVHIDDAARAVVAAVSRDDVTGTINVVDDEAVSLGDVADELAGILGVRRPWRVPPQVFRLAGSYLALATSTNLICSNERARALLGWTPRWPTYREQLREAFDPGATVGE